MLCQPRVRLPGSSGLSGQASRVRHQTNPDYRPNPGPSRALPGLLPRLALSPSFKHPLQDVRQPAFVSQAALCCAVSYFAASRQAQPRSGSPRPGTRPGFRYQPRPGRRQLRPVPSVVPAPGAVDHPGYRSAVSSSSSFRPLSPSACPRPGPLAGARLVRPTDRPYSVVSLSLSAQAACFLLLPDAAAARRPSHRRLPSLALGTPEPDRRRQAPDRLLLTDPLPYQPQTYTSSALSDQTISLSSFLQTLVSDVPSDQTPPRQTVALAAAQARTRAVHFVQPIVVQLPLSACCCCQVVVVVLHRPVPEPGPSSYPSSSSAVPRPRRQSSLSSVVSFDPSSSSPDLSSFWTPSDRLPASRVRPPGPDRVTGTVPGSVVVVRSSVHWTTLPPFVPDPVSDPTEHSVIVPSSSAFVQLSRPGFVACLPLLL